ncbi:unnamed protein product [Allacma fusca]|uniref:Uncharacterized protein n=1 Tax=Allacma fusca TaxID=39272 RepID=A0A8J2P6X4_9HEXA|nr:unnamed protein product [Allacma fusca]
MEQQFFKIVSLLKFFLRLQGVTKKKLLKANHVDTNFPTNNRTIEQFKVCGNLETPNRETALPPAIPYFLLNSKPESALKLSIGFEAL